MELETRYAASRGANIAYQVLGEGVLELLSVPAFVSNIEMITPGTGELGRFIARLGRFARLVQFDRRGSGMSDGAGAVSTLEEQLDDVAAVIRDAGLDRPALISLNEGAALALLYAATYPERVRALVLMTPQVRLLEDADYEWGLTVEERAAVVARVVEQWGRDSEENPWLIFGGTQPDARAQMARYQRLAMGPGDARRTLELGGRIDVREILPTIQCPTLVMRRRGDRFLDERHSRYVAERVPDARYRELEGDTPVWVGDREEAAGEIEEFLTGVRPPEPSQRVLATVLFTDIVGSTELAARFGDSQWRELLQRHDRLVRAAVEWQRGRVVKSLGDGALAVFDGPTRALAAALAIRDAVGGLGMQVRAGVHTGECELIGDDLGGIAVHIAARIAALAEAGQVLASGTVRDLSIGSPIELESRGEPRLKGFAEPWRVYAVRS